LRTSAAKYAHRIESKRKERTFMSARRIKIKARREARKQAAQASNSPVTPSDIFGSSAVDPDDDYDPDVDFPCPELDPAYGPKPVDVHALMEKIRRDPSLAVAARQRLDARGLSHMYNTDWLKTGIWPDTSTSLGGADPMVRAGSPEPAPRDTAPAAASEPAAGHSTGPRSPEGKARSSQNAMKHGLTATGGAALVFLSSEEADHYATLSAHFTQQFVPMTGAERETVREIVDALSLARRARDLQASALQEADDRALALYLRYETAHLRAHNAAIKTLLVLQKDRRQRNENHEKWNEPVHWGEYTFISDNDSYDAKTSESSAAAATSVSPADSDSSFRSAGFKPRSEMTFGAQNYDEAASEEVLEEVKPAA
jgi:hypothetical protein